MRDYFGKQIKKLGFGLMRLPVLGTDERSPIDIDQLKQMVDLYLENGYTYFDSAYNYHGGMSEVAFREAVSSRYPRDAFQFTTKLPLRRPMDFDEMRALTNESLERSGLEYFDLYFIHGIRPDSIEMINNARGWDYIQGLKQEGIAKNVGFSYHGDAAGLARILDARQAGDIDIVQLQINYLDWESPQVQSRLCYETCVERGIGVIVMEPIKGGSLANFGGDIADIFKAADPEASIASWALRFVMELEGVVTVLSGMSALNQVEDNVRTANSYKPLTEADHAMIKEVITAIDSVPLIQCTDCRYCLDDCPENINTPRIMDAMNDYIKYNNLQGARRQYGFATMPGPGGGAPYGKSSDCTECGTCEKVCPQELEIMEIHKQAVALFEQ
ncbi:MAG: aldo/keto reductase [Coriobacteriia bacterium]|nr:aldo/keto reductase [Coriobacteriia bacterium]